MEIPQMSVCEKTKRFIRAKQNIFDWFSDNLIPALLETSI